MDTPQDLGWSVQAMNTTGEELRRGGLFTGVDGCIYAGGDVARVSGVMLCGLIPLARTGILGSALSTYS